VSFIFRKSLKILKKLLEITVFAETLIKNQKSSPRAVKKIYF
jgi:hypothetical protein